MAYAQRWAKPFYDQLRTEQNAWVAAEVRDWRARGYSTFRMTTRIDAVDGTMIFMIDGKEIAHYVVAF